MSVFTNVKQPQLEAFLERYDIGRLRAFGPIAAGITNTNYTLDTEAGAFVLTLYEHHSDDELDYMLGLQRHLADRSVACAAPVGDRRGDYFSPLNQRPAAIIMRLPGEVQPRTVPRSAPSWRAFMPPAWISPAGASTRAAPTGYSRSATCWMPTSTTPTGC